VVHMSEVLEHIPDPRGILQIARSLLAPEGLICVVAPNGYNPFQYALRTACGYQPWWVAPPHHINYFDFDSLSQLLLNGGFEVVLKEAIFTIDMFLLMGDNYIGKDALG
jgi:2-polyprenyl-3-methyl-5-hydroxy-6-metoxy-1,4-benzoquinol methylase